MSFTYSLFTIHYSLFTIHYLRFAIYYSRIVPYVNPLTTGSVSGIIGAGGNVGAVVFGLFFRQFDSKTAFVLMGTVIMCSSVLSLFIRIRGHVNLFLRADNENEITIEKLSDLSTSSSNDGSTDSDTNMSSPISPMSQNSDHAHFPVNAGVAL